MIYKIDDKMCDLFVGIEENVAVEYPADRFLEYF